MPKNALVSRPLTAIATLALAGACFSAPATALASDSLLAIFGLLGNSLVDFWEYAVYIAVGFFAVSILPGGIGSVFSIGRYLKEQGSVVLDEN